MNPVELLGEIIEISHSNLEINSRISTIVNIIAHEMGFEEVLVFTFDKDKRLTCKYMNQKSMLFGIVSRYRCHIGEGVVGSIAQRRAPQYFTYKDIPPRFGCIFYPDLDSAIGAYKSFSFIPMSDDSYLYGVLVVISASRDSLYDREKVILSIISREIGGLLRAEELVISSKKRISELVTLSELGKILTSNVEPQILFKNIALIIAKAMNAVSVTIKLEQAPLRFGMQRFTYGNVDPSMEKQIEESELEAIRSKRTVSSDYYKNGQNNNASRYSIYSSPILTRNNVLGVLTICGIKSQKNAPMDDNFPYLINTVTNYISSGLENTLLSIRLKDVIKELNNTQKRIIDQEKFRSLGEMTANIAHEIKNPLVIIGGFTKRLAKKIHLDQTENRYVDIIVKEVARLESILNEILDYVKETPVATEICNINECIDDILYLFSSDTAWENIEIIKDYDDTLPIITCDIQQIKQVFINIFMNAYEAMQGKGLIKIKTQSQMEDDKNYIVVSITDTGGGIDPTVIDNIFNPFFTTKERGTGLGLAISNKIVMNNNGKIEVENIVGKGVTFFVYLPLKNHLSKEE